MQIRQMECIKMFKQEEVVTYAANNIATLVESMDPIAKGRFLGGVVEVMAANEMGGTFVDEHGYDYNHPELGKVEVKSTSDVQRDKCFRIQSLNTKRNQCDYIHIIEMKNDRNFMIPHDVFFEQLDLYENGNVLRWSSSYNSNDRVRVSNTQILLRYEV